MARMIPHRISFALLAVLISLSVTPHLSAAGRAPTRTVRTEPAGVWADLGRAVSSLLDIFAKSGNSLDPDGGSAPGAGTPQTSGDGGDTAESGNSLDPDGKK